jgi:hypothetical protein
MDRKDGDSAVRKRKNIDKNKIKRWINKCDGATVNELSLVSESNYSATVWADVTVITEGQSSRYSGEVGLEKEFGQWIISEWGIR